MRCINKEAYNYLAKLWIDCKPKIRPAIDSFNSLVEADVHNLLEVDKEYKVLTTVWPVIPDKKEIRNY